MCVLTLTLFIIFLATFYIKYAYKFIDIPTCIIYETFGIYCPGCGATRAVYSLYSGEILKSIYYNPLIVYLIIIDFWYLLTEGVSKFSKKENKFFIKRINLYLYFAVIILTLNWIIKLILLYNGFYI